MLGLDPSIAISIHDRKMARRQPIRAESDPRVEPEDDDGVLEDDDGVVEDDDGVVEDDDGVVEDDDGVVEDDGGACRSAIMRTAA
jgi:hypothetical protein